MSKKAIFEPIKIGPVTLKNRIEVAPAAPFLAGHDASVTPEFFRYTCNPVSYTHLRCHSHSTLSAL